MPTGDVAARLPCVEVESAASPHATVIWMHGLGADGHDFEPIVPELRLPFAVRYIFPHAPHRPVAVNGGYVMRAWYDIAAFDLSRGEDAEGIHTSAVQLEALIAREIKRGMPARRIVLAGFSQGGAMALHTGLRHREGLAGVLALSTYLALAGTLAAEGADANRSIPIFMGHGRDDAVVPLPHALVSRRRLEEAGYAVEWHEYAMAHALCGEEVADIRNWLAGVLAE